MAVSGFAVFIRILRKHCFATLPVWVYLNFKWFLSDAFAKEKQIFSRFEKKRICSLCEVIDFDDKFQNKYPYLFFQYGFIISLFLWAKAIILRQIIISFIESFGTTLSFNYGDLPVFYRQLNAILFLSEASKKLNFG